MAAPAKHRQEFRVLIEGVELSAEHVAQINRAVQKAATLELAGLDLQGDFHWHIPPRNWGIWFGPLSKDQLAKAGIKAPAEFAGP